MKQKNIDEKEFLTVDFYLAAFLRAKGEKTLGTKRINPQKLVFIFKETENQQQLLNDFLFGRANIEPQSFIAAIKELKQVLYLKKY